MVLAAGCAASNGTRGAQPRAAAAVDTDIVLYGKLAPRLATQVVGATVAVYEILPDARLMPIADHVVQTQGDGIYRLHVRLAPQNRGPLLVRADCEFGYGMVLVADTQVVNGAMAALPITDATTVQAEVYLTARQQRLWPVSLDIAVLRRFVGEGLAHAVLMEKDHAQAVGALSRAVTAAALGFDTTLRQRHGGLSEAQGRQAAKVMDAATFALADGLFHATDAAAVEVVQAEFEATLKQMEMTEGLPPAVWATASQAGAETFLAYVPALSPALQTQATMEIEQGRARDVVNLINRTFTGVGDDAALHDLQSASETLLAALSKLHGSSAEAAAAARSAWSTYQTTLGQALPHLVDTASQADLARDLASLDRQAAAATDGLRRVDAQWEPRAAAAEVSRQLTSCLISPLTLQRCRLLSPVKAPSPPWAM